ncbi:hypothetical protein [Idiomarina piscisalsi]|uniref:hypothetical protein n=1 Tax=Idiomarina piscisalsi TaxID=1096243 RepID=UPI0013829923|nr:hypothetical protein [Idiomarina piscisalsi]MTJ02686.1 hypothetical protein [Idiomarina piscisalsi]
MHKLFIGMAAIALSATSFAQQSGLEACADIENSLERLVCYDNLAKKEQSGKQRRQDRELPEQARKGKQKAAEMREKAQERRENTNDRFGLEHKEKEENEEERISVTLADREEGPFGKWRITLTNGQVWKQTDSGYFSWDGDSYYIERGALNSFFFGREGSNRRMRVQRIK